MRNRLLIISMAIVLFFSGTVYCLHKKGISSRGYKKSFAISNKDVPVFVLGKTTDVYSLWKKNGVEGRILIQMGKYLHFVGIENSSLINLVQAEASLKNIDITSEYEKSLSYRNFLWLAMESNIARQIYNVLSPDAFKEKLKAHMEKTNDGGDGEITINYMGSKRVISSRIPNIDEPVILNIDASFFDFSNIAGFVNNLKTSSLRVDIVTFCLSKDNPDITDLERERLLEAARVFSAEKGERGER